MFWICGKDGKRGRIDGASVTIALMPSHRRLVWAAKKVEQAAELSCPLFVPKGCRIFAPKGLTFSQPRATPWGEGTRSRESGPTGQPFADTAADKGGPVGPAIANIVFMFPWAMPRAERTAGPSARTLLHSSGTILLIASQLSYKRPRFFSAHGLCAAGRHQGCDNSAWLVCIGQKAPPLAARVQRR
jgi:hypothetical protein